MDGFGNVLADNRERILGTRIIPVSTAEFPISTKPCLVRSMRVGLLLLRSIL
jgi:hypothetical protein